MSGLLGWDIGGVNTKAARVAGAAAGRGRVLAVRAAPYEVQRDPAALAPLLARLAAELDAGPGDAHGVTMTAELSQLFRTKRDGVGFVLDAVAAAFPHAEVRVWSVDGRWRTPDEARRDPLAVAAANWAATARLVSRSVRDCLLIDTGSTTTDIIPIVGGEPAAAGRTDLERLREGELVYSGALRTPIEAIATSVPVGGRPTGVSAEGFALAGDVYLWRGQLDPVDYAVPTPDGRPATREFAGERLARVVCADRELLDAAATGAIADALWEAQVTRIRGAVDRVRARHPALEQAVVTGLGDFLATEAARRAGLEVTHLAGLLGPAARHAPAAAVALLLAAERAAEALPS
ncbi:MAG TPA: hydantoinase/oxoprolinase family protein [Gemmatimonadales bacterium]